MNRTGLLEVESLGSGYIEMYATTFEVVTLPDSKP